MMINMNRKIESAAVIGAGALGLMYADGLSRSLGEKAFFLAEEDRAGRINSTEYSINGKKRSFRALTPHHLDCPADLVLLAVKNHHIDDILPLVKATSGPDTVLVSVLNGIESEKRLEAAVPASTVLYCIAVAMDAVKEGDTLTFTSPGRLVIGAKDNNPDDPALKSAVAVLEASGVACEVPDDIQRAVYWKWMLNIGTNQVSASIGGNYGVLQTSREAQNVMNGAMMEAVKVAQAEGINLREEDVQGIYPILNGLGPQGKTSMLQDVEAKRKTEVEAFSGKLIELAEKHGISVPVNRTLYQALTSLESRSCGI